MRTLIGLFSFLIIIQIGSSQEALGLKYGKYNGINSASLNPALTLRNQNKWDLQLIGAHAFVQSNYGFLYQSNLIHTLRNQDQIQIANTDTPVNELELPFVYKTNSQSIYIDTKAEILGPGILLSLGDDTKVGLFSKVRYYGGGFNIPASLNQASVDTLNLNSQLDVGPFDLNAQAWGEVALHFSKALNRNNSFGINIKYLKSLGAGYFNNKTNISVLNAGSNQVNSITEGSIEFASTNEIGDRTFFGSGFGTDIGWTGTNLFNQNAILGISLIDLGWINNNSTSYTISVNNTNNINLEDYENINNREELINQLESDLITIDSTQQFGMVLPTALSIQYLLPITEKLSIENNWVQRIKIFDQQLERSNSLNSTLVYDSKHISAFLPLSWYNYQEVHVGLAFRFLFFTIGTDDLLSIVGRQNQLNGTDVYANIKIYPFGKNAASANSQLNKISCYF